MKPSKKPLIDETGVALEFDSVHDFLCFDEENGKAFAVIGAKDNEDVVHRRSREVKPKHLRAIARALLEMADRADKVKTEYFRVVGHTYRVRPDCKPELLVDGVWLYSRSFTTRKDLFDYEVQVISPDEIPSGTLG